MPCGCGTGDGALYAGSRPQVTMTFTDDDGNPADPTALTVKVLFPDDSTDTWTMLDAEVTQESTGVWVFEFPAGLDPGDHWVYVLAEDPDGDVASQLQITILDTHVPLGV